MGFKCSWVPDDATLSSPLILCLSTRSVAEHNVRLNNRSLSELAEPYQSDFTRNFDRSNDRNVFSFDCDRSDDFDGAPFVDAEAAAQFAFLHLGGGKDTAIHGTGVLNLVLTGKVTQVNIQLANVVKQSVDWAEWSGTLIKLSYVFTCGLISTQA